MKKTVSDFLMRKNFRVGNIKTYNWCTYIAITVIIPTKWSVHIRQNKC